MAQVWYIIILCAPYLIDDVALSMVHKRLLAIEPSLGEHVAVFQSAHRGVHALAVGVEDLGQLGDVVERLIAFK